MSASEPAEPDQLALVAAPGRRRFRTREPEPLAGERQVASVLVDVGLPHLDRPFDYLVPASMDDDAVVGARVSVRFAGTDHDGFVVARKDSSDHDGKLARLRRVVSAEPVLAPEIVALARAVADRYAGTVSDVLRLAVPPRHATAEKAASPEPPDAPERPDPGGWAEHVDGVALLDALAGGGAPRAVWNPGPAADWPDLVARLVATTLSAGRGALVVLPDGRDLELASAALTALLGAGSHVELAADAGPSTRYKRWLAVRRGAVRAVVGTRSAAFAPVHDLGLVVVWDDGDDLHAEPRAPYPHAREVLLLRAFQAGAAAVVGGFARTAEAEQLVATGWARPVTPSRPAVRAAAPRVHSSGDDHEQARDEAARTARLPSLAWRTARAGLGRGPVLVQVPRAGYLPGVACGRCRTPARCTACSGPLVLGQADRPPRCAWCATEYPSWRCGECGHGALRATVVGVRRTAEELGRAFPGVPVLLSRGDAVRSSVEAEPALVVATPGAEPVAAGGYAAALLLDGTALLARTGLRAAEEALRRWLRAAALVRPGTMGGEIVVVADPGAPAVQALVRWDPAGFAGRELAERSGLHLPPAARVAELTGAPADVDDLLMHLDLPDGAEVIGPVPVDDGARAMIRAPRAAGTALAGALRSAAGIRSARRTGGSVRVRVDPVDFG
ncbi:primosomal protein N' [Jiangella sp. DSM 45060]|uniref:primosomal protein N' n=1 Tax=Jiangella sp. DSM 45060 TaxID=1798224 RepID=UPI00087C0187|nr:primosomal protein N' [Jiangella sp. DSM 45060]SDS90297.1 replication restart DNA helicase PriA [Jiangella sp. DSM 45060]